MVTEQCALAATSAATDPRTRRANADPRIADDNVVEAILIGIVDGDCGGIPPNDPYGVGARKSRCIRDPSRSVDDLFQFVIGPLRIAAGPNIHSQDVHRDDR